MKYDLHIHSALSPCSDDDMTPNNIVNMAIIKGLDIISVTDHNAIDNQKVIADVAFEHNLKYIFGVEVQTIEEVHILCYFKEYVQIQEFGKYLEQYLIKLTNDEKYFGRQLIFDYDDEITSCKEHLLITSINQNINQLIAMVKSLNGYIVLAHPLARQNGIITILGFIPCDLIYDGIEISDDTQMTLLIEKYKVAKDKLFLTNSDAHQLVDIAEDNSIEDLFKRWNIL